MVLFSNAFLALERKNKCQHGFIISKELSNFSFVLTSMFVPTLLPHDRKSKRNSKLRRMFRSRGMTEKNFSIDMVIYLIIQDEGCLL